MRNVTRPGVDPDSGYFPAPEPVFPPDRQPPFGMALRSARRSSAPDAAEASDRMPLPSAWPFESELEYPLDDDELDDEAYSRVQRRRTPRRMAVNVFGLVTLAIVLYACGSILGHRQAGRAALSWATLDHADQVAGVVNDVGSTVRTFGTTW